MNTHHVDQLVEAVLYEGHILYPYRPSSRKNRQRFTFGRVYPESYSVAQDGLEPCRLQAQCLLRPLDEMVEVEATVRFLQPVSREVGLLRTPTRLWPLADEAPVDSVPVLDLDGAIYQSWQEAIERSVQVTLRTPGRPLVTLPFSFPASRDREPIRDREMNIVAVITRQRAEISGELEAAIESIDGEVSRVNVRVVNRSPLPASAAGDSDAVLMHTMTSAHVVLRATGAEFVSLTDPPAQWAAAAAACCNIGVWPVLVGDGTGQAADTMLASPIILADHPQIAPESAGGLCDSTEIDEILSLRILTMTDEEKREMRHADEQARRILERTESLDGDQWLRMHGVMREPSPVAEAIFTGNTRLDVVEIAGAAVRRGDRVRIRPRARADIMDIALAGRLAIVEAVEQDAEGKVHLAVVFEDDPGKDLGFLRQPGHRFFYGTDEVEPWRREVAP